MPHRPTSPGTRTGTVSSRWARRGGGCSRPLRRPTRRSRQPASGRAVRGRIVTFPADPDERNESAVLVTAIDCPTNDYPTNDSASYRSASPSPAAGNWGAVVDRRRGPGRRRHPHRRHGPDRHQPTPSRPPSGSLSELSDVTRQRLRQPTGVAATDGVEHNALRMASRRFDRRPSVPPIRIDTARAVFRRDECVAATSAWPSRLADRGKPPKSSRHAHGRRAQRVEHRMTAMTGALASATSN